MHLLLSQFFCNHAQWKSTKRYRRKKKKTLFLLSFWAAEAVPTWNSALWDYFWWCRRSWSQKIRVWRDNRTEYLHENEVHSLYTWLYPTAQSSIYNRLEHGSAFDFWTFYITYFGKSTNVNSLFLSWQPERVRTSCGESIQTGSRGASASSPALETTTRPWDKTLLSPEGVEAWHPMKRWAKKLLLSRVYLQ